MKTIPFLSTLAHHILKHHSTKMECLTVVLPNKRAKVFLLEELKKGIQQNSFAPKIVSIEEFVQDIAGIRSADAITLLFEFYTLYLSLTPSKEQQAFEQFSNWGKTLLHDFNEIDRYLLEPKHVFSYLKDIEAIKRWNLEAEDKTKLIDNYLQFWEKMPLYYEAFYDYLVKKGIGYQGLIYREAVDNLTHFSSNNTSNHYIFAGFNALNQAEEKIFQHLLTQELATVLWDVEETFLNDPYHDAGLFARKIKKSWPFYKNNPYQWIFNEFKESKNIHIMGTPKTIGQAKLAGHLIETIAAEESLENVALVLGQEELLIPLLHSLPQSASKLNITMGYSGKNNPAQLLVSKLFRMHQNAFKRSATSYMFYYKDILDVLQNPLVEPFVGAKSLISRINQNNYTFVSYAKVIELNEQPTPFFLLLMEKWNSNPTEILAKITTILLEIKQFLQTQSAEDKITVSFLYAIFKIINKLTNFCTEHSHINSIEGLFALYKQIVDLAEVSFEGEPLEGLQIMGVLESRVLDFDTVIITSMNEGVFPAGKSQNSFIPLDVKRELGLPTFKEKDAIYTYHFYHLLQRAKTIYLLYNTEAEGLDAGEKSRFITQLEVEKQPNHVISHQLYNAVLPEKANELMLVPKSDLVLQRLKIMANEGFSPSTLTTYIRNPIQFYFQRILRIRETEEVEENIAVNTLGTIIHGTLEELYKPFLNVFLTVSIVDSLFLLVNEEVFNQFKKEYKEGEITKGKNLLAFEVAKRNVFNFLQQEKKALEQGDAIKILFLEQNFSQEIVDNRLPFPVKIRGNVDRIELRNGTLRIIDYKTGKVEQPSLSIQGWTGLTEDIKYDKIIQLMCYALMVQTEFPQQEMEVGIISFKNLRAGFMPFQIKEGREVVTHLVNNEVIEDFKTELIQLINLILDENIPFEEK
ncbi:PD-(D/E)XK nuclease family protein [Flavobacterium sp.]|uniref:PD-(D/E)XK nuclease family protein n=1 Tax=Flavobacterium sp. TaxID=239 RepID=UPI00262A289D|nr:PD-(D/E)XK nuclease family protein [Flavobacterium sp.]MDD2984801.1 PD-(D/E)XK nuclease family protein [Flavobacterium sp.]